MKIILAVPNDGTPKLVKLKKNIPRCQRCVYNGGFKIKKKKYFPWGQMVSVWVY